MGGEKTVGHFGHRLIRYLTAKYIGKSRPDIEGSLHFKFH